ncbi:MAG: transcription-repair coupling factor [Spirochaetes bacterium]|nr:transcription-repair coupling factor [Spirochaetota bacterium]
MTLKPLCDIFRESDEFHSLKEALDNAGERPVMVEGIASSSFPVIAASLFNDSPCQTIVVTENYQKMHTMHLDLSAMVDESLLFVFPPWETIPYEFVSPTEITERERITALYRLLRGDPALVVTTVESLIRKVPGRGFFEKKGVSLIKGEDYPFDDIVTMLADYGYSREKRVDSFGQFSVKGGIIDIYPPSHDNPLRLDFFGDTIESIREFDINSQISSDAYESVTIYPRKELVLLKGERDTLLNVMKDAADRGLDLPEGILSQLKEGCLEKVDGIEDLFPLVTAGETLLSYLRDDARIIFLEPAELESRKNQIEKIFRELYIKKRNVTLCLPPNHLIDPGSLEGARQRSLCLQTFTASRESLKFQLKGIPSFHGRIKQVREEIAGRLADGWRVIVTTGFEGQARRLYDLLSEFKPDSRFEEFTESGLNILLSPFSGGLEIALSKIIIISDQEIFGKSYRKKREFKKKTSRPIDSFLDLRPGDYVVHINHGIGLFQKVERMSAGGVERDFLLIEYAEGDKLYVSLDQITMVQKYIGIEGRKPRIDNLGRKSAWNRIKDKVQKSVEEVAAELIRIYSARRALKGFQFPPDTQWQEEFEALFEFEETPDQITAIEDVKDDMEALRPMDRLICGDVGFGKTEVAIRAAFKAVMAGRQVAILVPTTVLAMQHYTTFTRRFQSYPIEIEMISRFRSPAEIKRIKASLKNGAIDIIIGTHALLAKDIAIKNLGLLVIDEEQRFGVRHKEQLKKFRTMVDVMTLSATPIPRTLHMAMAGIRDLSIILTPPENRQAIETYVLEENPDILRMAIMNELERNGQVFYVHNRVQTIEAHAIMLKELVPEATCAVAHGQMPEHDLEDVMIDFMNGKFDILASTSIIESGLDMPNVNTIIINRSDAFGLSQLYQLKGRVGRSMRKAYAYLFYPRHIPLTEEAMKRLRVIAEYSDLGSGFKIAMKDLEIRGAGNILGLQQSGNIFEVGFELYLQMLDNAIRLLKGEPVSSYFRTPLFLKTDFFIPDSYINDEKQKIEFYKRFESCDSVEEVEQLEKELVDRFGAYPEEVGILIEIEKIRTMASLMYIDEILEDSRSIRIKISGNAKVDVRKVVGLIASDRRLSLDPVDRETLIFVPESMKPEKKVPALKKLLQQLM